MKIKLSFAFFVVILVTIIYAPITYLGFANIDDEWILLNHPIVQANAPNIHFFTALFTDTQYLMYSPINTLYYYLIYQLNGYNPYYYHLGSLFIHLLNISLIFILMKKILNVFSVENAEIVAYSIAVTWAVLPFNVQSVVWISATKVLLFAFFGNISFICFIKAYIKASKTWYFLSIIAFVLSCLAKEQGVLYALVITLFVYLYQSKIDSKINVKKIINTAGPFILLGFFIGLFMTWVNVTGKEQHVFDYYPFHQRIFLSFYCVWIYALKTLIPISLQLRYPYPMKYGHSLPLIYYSYPFVIMFITWLSYLILKKNKDKEVFYLGFGIFIFHLLLCIQVIQMPRISLYADRYTYLSSGGLLLIFFLILNQKFDLSFKSTSRLQNIAFAGFILYIILLTGYSYTLTKAWEMMQL
ncbi:MAG: hypothetical protein V4553_16205 [Bacteroidota bacterium]